jgi:predicted cupin superfamily sugar epimerase
METGGVRGLPVGRSVVVVWFVPEVAQLIARFGLRPLPQEGGWFARTWTSTETLSGAALPQRYGGGSRPAGTGILYLLADGECSALHRLRSDETWHFHAGAAVDLLCLDPSTGCGGRVRLGPAVLGSDAPQLVVPHGCWQGARLAAGGRWALLGCTMAPGWDDADFELARRDELVAAWPQFAHDIAALTREG